MEKLMEIDDRVKEQELLDKCGIVEQVGWYEAQGHIK